MLMSRKGDVLAVGRGSQIEIFALDPAIASAELETRETSVAAKVLLVGPGRVGKSCLAERLVHDTYSDQPSTHGMRFWSVPSSPFNGLKREVVLWDLGGQSVYRLLHQLFLPHAELALLLVEPGTESYDDVRQWSDRLDSVPGDCKKVLVGTKVDGADAPTDHAALQRLAKEIDAVGVVLTSAMTSRGCVDLLDEIERQIPWDKLTKVMKGRAGEWLDAHIASLLCKGTVIARPEDFVLPNEIGRGDIQPAIEQLARRGTLADTRTATGQQVLVLRVDEIERYACSLIVAAQRRPGGVPALDAAALHIARIRLPGIADNERLVREDERIVLDCVVEMLLEHGIALMHHGQLVFPSLFEIDADESHDSQSYAQFAFGGPVDSVYAALVTDLALTKAYGTPRMSRWAARFTRADFGTCGIRRVVDTQKIAGWRAGLEVFFEGETDESAQLAFVHFVETHLQDAGISVLKGHRLVCDGCGSAFRCEDIEHRLDCGKEDMVCSRCDRRQTLVSLRHNEARRRDTAAQERVEHEQHNARLGRERSVVSGVQRIEAGEPDDTPHWVLVLSDLHVGVDSDIATMRQTLVEDLRRNDWANPARLAALVVCGDVTNLAKPAEFEKAHDLIGGLIEQLPGLTAGNTVVVPGNHDVSWDDPDIYKHHPGARPPGKTDDEFISRDGIQLLRDEKAYNASFGNFSSGLYQTLYQRAYPTKPAEQFDVFDVPQAGITFLTFNSAWNTARYSPNSPRIVDAAVGSALARLSEVPTNRLKIAVWHHPITGNEKIKNDAFVERLRAAGVRLCLHGHVHESRCELLGYAHSCSMNVIGTGSFGSAPHDRPESTPRLYHLLEVDRGHGSVRVHTRQRTQCGAPWGPFYEWPDPSNSGNRLSHLDIVLPGSRQG